MTTRENRKIKIGPERRLAAFLLGMFASILQLWRWRHRVRSTFSGCRDILILEPFGMGDVISLEPLVRILNREKFRVHICAKNTWRSILPKEHVLTWLDSKIPWTSYDVREKYKWRTICNPEFRKFFKELQSIGKRTIGFDTRGDIRSVILLHLAGCRKVYTLSHYLGTNLKILPLAASIIHTSDDLQRWRLNLKFLKVVGRTWEKDVDPPSISHLLSTTPLHNSKTIALIPVSPWPGKLWQTTKWQELAQKISGLGLNPVGLCGPGELGIAKGILGSAVQINECASVEDWVRQLQVVCAVITVNTGPMHLADALGKPLVVIDGSSKLPLWAPSGKKSRIIHHQDEIECAPCHQVDFSAKCGYECMQRIHVDEVFNALQEVLTLPQSEI